MQPDIAKNISEKLFQRFGIELLFEIRNQKEGSLLILKPADLYPKEGFNINILVGWKKLTISFEPEDNAGELLLTMGYAAATNYETFRSMIKSITSEGGSLVMTINSNPVKLNNISDWPKNWHNLKLVIKSPFIESDTDLALDRNLEEHIEKWSTLFFSLIVPMLPLDEQIDIKTEHNVEGLPEGAQLKILVNRYERSRINRQICIVVHGAYCNICGFNFRKQYGVTGEGYIEVHHKVPVSELGKNYRIDPINDLIPVCANCHAMIHKRNPPYSPDEIKLLLSSASQSAI